MVHSSVPACTDAVIQPEQSSNMRCSMSHGERLGSPDVGNRREFVGRRHVDMFRRFTRLENFPIGYGSDAALCAEWVCIFSLASRRALLGNL